MIKRVRSIHAKRELEAFSNAEHLHDRRIEVNKLRSIELVNRIVAERVRSRILKRSSASQKLCRCFTDNPMSSVLVRSVGAAGTFIRNIVRARIRLARIRIDGRVERASTVVREDSAQVPAAKNSVDELVYIA